MDIWQASPEKLLLPPDLVHVWLADLDPPAEQIPALRDMLSPDELDRAGRFRFERDQRRYTVGRAALRTILATYLSSSPDEVCFDYTHYGKPYLVSGFGQHGLKFNLAHSGDMALYAIVRERDIGIDIEQIRADVNYAEIATRFFSAGEIASLHDLPVELRRRGFFVYWTRKEAYIKACGEGLSRPFDGFDVSSASDTSNAPFPNPGYSKEIDGWQLRDLHPGAGCAGALAVRGSGWSVRGWQWKPPMV